MNVDEAGAVVDENGNPVLDESGNPVRVNEQGVVVDANGNPIKNADGEPVMLGDPGLDDLQEGANPSSSGELADCSTPGPRQVRRLTADQYYRTLQDVFGDQQVPREGVLSDPSVLGFHVDSATSVVRDLEGELLMNYAESIADWAVDGGSAYQFASCTEQQEQCQRDFVANLGAKTQREPLSDTRISSYRTLFDAESSFQDGMRAVISALLQSPYTLYRRELGVQRDGEYQLTAYEVASQLAYWLTDAPPDAQLYDAAANGRLDTTQGLLQEASRLLEAEGARESLGQFVEGWLHLDKLPSKAKDESILPLPAELRASMLRETHELFLHTFYEEGTLTDLFTTRQSYVDQSLADLYGIAAPGQEFAKVALSGSRRAAGILGHAAFLTTHALSNNSSPVQRAKIVIERLLCGTLPPVPSNVNTKLDTQTEFSTNRERYEVHRQREECRGCHENLDPIGYAFEHYDGFGRYRDLENGVAIDATGSLAYLGSGRVELDGVDSLSEAIADSPELQSCVVRYWSYYAFGAEGWEGAECNRDEVIRHARSEDFTLKSIVMGIVQSPHLSRRVADL